MLCILQISYLLCRRMFDLINKASFELTLEDVISKRTIPSTHVYNAKQIDQSITLTKVEDSIEVCNPLQNSVGALNHFHHVSTFQFMLHLCLPISLSACLCRLFAQLY